MGLFNQRSAFIACRNKTVPVYRVPKSVQEILQIKEVYQDGIFEVEPSNSSGTNERLWDKAYIFQDINYVDKDAGEKDEVCLNYCKILNMLNLNFKISLINKPRNIHDFKERILYDTRDSRYPELAEDNNKIILEAMKKGHPELKQIRILTVTTKACDYEAARRFFDTLEITLIPAFRECESVLEPMNIMERLGILHDLHRPEHAGDFPYSWEELRQKRDWRNEICPLSFSQDEREADYIKLGHQYTSVLFSQTIPNSLDESKVISGFFNVGFPSIITLDVGHIPRNILTGKLSASYSNNEMAINREAAVNAKNSNIAAPPSYQKQRNRDDLEDAMENIDENDENGFYLGMLIAVMADSLEDLDRRVETIHLQARRLGIEMIPYEYEQLQAWNTVLPYGTRQVNYMRPMLTNSMVAFQPFYAIDVIEPGGYFFGLNKRTKNIIVLNRKNLKNSNGIIFGHSGAGKSFTLKMTEIGQTLLHPDQDDIFMIDPQSEAEGIVQYFGGQFFDLSAQSGHYINPFEVPEAIFYGDSKAKNNFIQEQTSFAEAFCYATMKGIVPVGIHKTIINQCVIQMYQETFSGKKLVQPTLNDLYRWLQKSDDPEARDIYGSLGAYVEGGSFDLFAHASNVDIHNRFVVFGLHNVSDDLWEPAMITVMHFLAQRIEHNVQLHKATRFIVDEAQYISRNRYSAEQLRKAFLTFRKYGGICTILMQNVAAALSNNIIKEIVDNAEFKLFLDQGGSDRNALAEIMELSHSEYRALGEKEVGQSVISWAGKVLLCDMRISKNHPLYNIYSTNFHEAAKEGRKVFFSVDPEPAKEQSLEKSLSLEEKQETVIQEEKKKDPLAWMLLEDLLPLSREEALMVLDGKEEDLEILLHNGKLKEHEGKYYAA